MKSIFAYLSLCVVSIPAQAGAVMSSGSWGKSEIKVCFAKEEQRKRNFGNGNIVKISAWTDERKEKVERWVREEYSESRTIVHFSGFEDCDLVNDYDVPLFFGKGSGLGMLLFGGNQGFAQMGKQLAPGNLPGFPIATSYAWFNSAGFTKSTIIHEFGHLARLAHEHERLEALQDPNCRFVDKKLKGQFLINGIVATGPYDKDSVMNYCRLESRGGKSLGLSPEDVANLRLIYSNSES